MNKGKGNIGVVFLLVLCILVMAVVIGMLYFTRSAVEEENLQGIYGIVLWSGIVILALTFITLFTYLGVNNKQDAKAREKKKSKKEDEYQPYREPVRKAPKQQQQPYQAPYQQQPYQSQPSNASLSQKEQDELARQQAKLADKQKNARGRAEEAPRQAQPQPQYQQQPRQAQPQPQQQPRQAQPQPQYQQRPQPQAQPQPQYQQQPRQAQSYADTAPQSDGAYAAQPVAPAGRTQSVEEKFNEIGKMGKTQFVVYMAKLFKLKGYQIMLTPVANNHGIDILVEKMNVKTAVSCVLSDKILTDAEVRAAEAGKGFYNCDRAMVVTNTYFDRMALAASKENNTALVDRNILSEDFMR